MFFIYFIHILMIVFKNENENGAGNFNSITINGVKFYFSYSTCVAVVLRTSFNGNYAYAIKNQWSTTTGKHLNWFSQDKKSRLSPEAFGEVLREAYRQVGLVPNESV